MRALTGRLLSSGAALGDTFRNPGLRRLQLAWVGSVLGSWAYFVALAVYAYDQGGAKGVALIGILRVLPAAILAPFLGSLVDRFPRRYVMVVADLVRAVLMGLAAVTIALSGPAWVVYGVVTVSTLAATPFRPAQAALMPTLARTPAELSAANVAASTLESAGSFIGPAIGGFLLAATSAQVVFALNGLTFVWSAALILSISVDESVDRRTGEADGSGHDVMAGFHTILEDRDVRVLVGLYAGQTLVAGALGVLVVVTALDLLNGGPKEVGLLDAATGVGGLAGSVVALALAARGRIAADFGLGLALFGALAIVGITPHLVSAVIALGVVGVGNSLVDIGAITLLQRIVANELLGRVLGLLQGILLACFGIGAATAPLLVHVAGVKTTLIVVGAVLPLLTVLAWIRLRRIDATILTPKLVALLREVEILEPLQPAALERLAMSLVEVPFPAGATVIGKGQPGDRFYIVEDGVVEIEGSSFGPGSSFGEIALLRDVPRTATVIAHTDVILQALEREDFLSAVTGSEPSSAVAESVIARRLGELRAT